MRLRRLGLDKARRRLIIIASLATVSTLGGPVTAQAEDRTYSAFFDNSSTYRGVHAQWTDQQWSSDECDWRVNQMINAVGNSNSTRLTWVQLGYQKNKFSIMGACQALHRYYWEWKTNDGYNRGDVECCSVSLGTHEWGLNRATFGCASGKAWCWHFRIDEVTKHTCCGEVSELSSSPEVSVQLECVHAVHASCPASGLANPLNLLSYKNTSDSWFDWAGQDDAVVHHCRGARGKWNSDTSVQGGYNVTMSGSLQSC